MMGVAGGRARQAWSGLCPGCRARGKEFERWGREEAGREGGGTQHYLN